MPDPLPTGNQAAATRTASSAAPAKAWQVLLALTGMSLLVTLSAGLLWAQRNALIERAEAQAQRGKCDNDIAQFQERIIVFSGKPDHRQKDPDEAAVAGHATLIDTQYQQRIAEKRRKVIEEHIAETTPDNDSGDNRSHQR